MLRIQQTLRSLITLALALTLAACASSKNKGGDYAGVDDGDFITGSSLPDRREGVSFLDGSVDKSQFSPVYFAFDSYVVDSSESRKLDAVADFLRSSDKEIIIAGFTDERGTAEYNRGLGEKRAQAVRSHLLSLGVSGQRVHTTSFGAEMPADPGYGEAAWAKNRRAEFGVIR